MFSFCFVPPVPDFTAMVPPWFQTKLLKTIVVPLVPPLARVSPGLPRRRVVLLVPRGSTTIGIYFFQNSIMTSSLGVIPAAIPRRWNQWNQHYYQQLKVEPRWNQTCDTRYKMRDRWYRSSIGSLQSVPICMMLLAKKLNVGFGGPIL